MAQAAPRLATSADLEAVPPHSVAESVDGVPELLAPFDAAFFPSADPAASAPPET